MGKLTENLVLARSRASDLDNVRKLNCWGNELNDISILQQMPNIEVVSLSVNAVTTLEDFSHCQNLQELYIRKNKIANLAEICHLRHLPKLRILWLADNPCAVGDRYRMTVLKALPNLQKLDNIPVEQEEVNDAIEQGIELSLPTLSSPSKPKKPVITAVTNKEDPPMKEDPATLTMEETNKIREQLGLKPLPANKVTPSKPAFASNRHRNANILQAVLCLIKELDSDSLETVGNAVKNRLESYV